MYLVQRPFLVGWSFVIFQFSESVVCSPYAEVPCGILSLSCLDTSIAESSVYSAFVCGDVEGSPFIEKLKPDPKGWFENDSRRLSPSPCVYMPERYPPDCLRGPRSLCYFSLRLLSFWLPSFPATFYYLCVLSPRDRLPTIPIYRFI